MPTTPDAPPSDHGARAHACLATVPFILIPVGLAPALAVTIWLLVAAPAGQTSGVLWMYGAGVALICAPIGLVGLLGAAVALVAIPELRTGGRLAFFWAGVAAAVAIATLLRR